MKNDNFEFITQLMSARLRSGASLSGTIPDRFYAKFKIAPDMSLNLNPLALPYYKKWRM